LTNLLLMGFRKLKGYYIEKKLHFNDIESPFCICSNSSEKMMI